MDKLEIILEWAGVKNERASKGFGKPFDTTFLESVKDFYADSGELTDAQENAIENIYEKWHIEEWLEGKNRPRKNI